MKFTTPDSDIHNAIDVLDKLINQKNSSNVMETIRRYKSSGTVDMFTSYRLNKQLRQIEKRF